MSELVPTTDDIRNSYIITPEDNESFDLWLASIRADAWAEGFDAGEKDYAGHVTFDEPCFQNPYKETQ